MERTWASEESHEASSSLAAIWLRSPTVSAAAIAPVEPGSSAWMRALASKSPAGDPLLDRGDGRGLLRRRQKPRRAEGVAIADAVEPGGAGEIVAAGRHRQGRRRQADAQRQPVRTGKAMDLAQGGEATGGGAGGS